MLETLPSRESLPDDPQEQGSPLNGEEMERLNKAAEEAEAQEPILMEQARRELDELLEKLDKASKSPESWGEAESEFQGQDIMESLRKKDEPETPLESRDKSPEKEAETSEELEELPIDEERAGKQKPSGETATSEEEDEAPDEKKDKKEGRENEEKNEQKERELMEKRKEAVNAWIEASKALIETSEEGLAVNVWNETANSEQGKRFLLDNIESTIRDSVAVQSYIEEGEPKGLNLRWKINFADYNLQSGETKAYITGIDVDMLVSDVPEKEQVQKPEEGIQKELLDEVQEKELENSEKIKKHKELKRFSAYMLP